ncbi:MAG: polyribonucleotide nucleotidyltransferase, partial [Alphaproteobacteria bacterium]
MNFFNIAREEINWGGRKLILETGKMARQADGAVVVYYGGTVVLCTAVIAREAKPGIDFFPLSVHYQEKTSAVGRIPGGFFKREGKPSEKEVLTSRLIDRPIRPLFAEHFKHEVQVICTVLSHDLENDPDIAALVGVSAALCLSGAPFLGPIAAARVGYLDGNYILNSTQEDKKTSQLDLIVAGTDTGVLMVESEAYELNEEIMLGAVNFGFQAFQPIIKMIQALKAKAAKPSISFVDSSVLLRLAETNVQKLIETDLRQAYGFAD